MKRLVRIWTAAALAVALAAQAAWAQQKLKPVALLVLPSYDELLADIDYLGTLADQQNAGKQIDALLTLFTGGQGLAGLDKSKPCGVALLLPQGQTVGLAFVPVTDLKKLLGALEGIVGQARESEDHQGVLELTIQGQTIYVKSAGGWAWASNSAEVLGQVPQSPQPWIGTLAKRYDVALEFRMRNVPEFFRQLALQALREGFLSALEQEDEEDGQQGGPHAGRLRELQKTFAQAQPKQVEDLITSLDVITIGCDVDRQGRVVALEFAVSFVPDSPFGKVIAESRAGQVTLGAFAPKGAMVRLHTSGQFGPNAQQYGLKQLDHLAKLIQEAIAEAELPDQESREAVKKLAKDLLQVWRQTIRSGEFEAAFSVENAEGRLFISGAALCAQGSDQVVRQVLELLQAEGVPVQFNAARQGGVTYHRIPLAGANEKLSQVFGQEVALAVGTGAKGVYFAFGNDALAELQKRVQASQGTPRPAQHYLTLVIAARPILQLLQDQLPDNPIVAQVAQLLPKEAKDQLRITADLDPQQASETVRFELDEGLLRLIIKGVQQVIQRFQQGVNGPAPVPQF